MRAAAAYAIARVVSSFTGLAFPERLKGHPSGIAATPAASAGVCFLVASHALPKRIFWEARALCSYPNSLKRVVTQARAANSCLSSGWPKADMS
jgi:hypothetical protein